MHINQPSNCYMYLSSRKSCERYNSDEKFPHSFIQCVIVSRWTLLTKDGLSHYRPVPELAQQLATSIDPVLE